VDQESSLRAGEVADSEAAVAVTLDDVMVVFELGADGVDAQAEETTGGQARLCGADVRVGARAIAVLEDLDADHERVALACRERAQVALDQTIPAARGALGQLRDRRRRDIEADDVEPGVDERQVVATVAAADVETTATDQTVRAGGGQDLGDERQRRFVTVAAGRVLGVPGRGGVAKLIRSCRHRLIVVAGADGSRGWRQ
jgi:hypothetical protein